MRKGGGQEKGADFERSICKRLSLWVSSGQHEDLFWRSAMSGGRATVAAKKGKILKHQAGDISAVSIQGHALTDQYYIECKSVSTLDIHGLIEGRGALWSFWCTAWDEAVQYEKAPMLIAKQNRFTTIVCLDRDSVTKLGLIGITSVIASPDSKTPRTMYIMELDALLSKSHLFRPP